MFVDYGVESHVGMVRETNEDSTLAWPARGLFIVADGMGGHGNGELASRQCVEAVQEFYTRAENQGLPADKEISLTDHRATVLSSAILHANERIRFLVEKRPSLQGMGTTIVAAQVESDVTLVAHAGDSRCYLLRGTTLYQLTEDHSLVNEVRGVGEITAEMEDKLANYQHVLVNAIGVNPAEKCRVDVTSFVPQGGDRMLLCSDGLTNEMDAEEIREMLDTIVGAQDVCTSLVAQSNARGGRDNITVLVVDWLEKQPGTDPDAEYGETVEFDLPWEE